MDSVTPSATTSLRTPYTFTSLFHSRNVAVVWCCLESNFSLILVCDGFLVGLQVCRMYPKMPTMLSSSLHLCLCEIPSPWVWLNFLIDFQYTLHGLSVLVQDCRKAVPCLVCALSLSYCLLSRNARPIKQQSRVLGNESCEQWIIFCISLYPVIFGHAAIFSKVLYLKSKMLGIVDCIWLSCFRVKPAVTLWAELRPDF